MATIKTAAELLAALAAATPTNPITPEMLEDFVESQGVGGIMRGKNQPLPVTTSWAAFSAFSEAVDSKGIDGNPATGHFDVLAGGDGMHIIDASIEVKSPGTGWVEIAIAKNGTTLVDFAKVNLVANEEATMCIASGGMYEAGDTYGLAIRASANATITLSNGQLRGFRAR